MKTKLRLLTLLFVAGLFSISTQSQAQQLLDIAKLKTVDADGTPDSIDVHCKVRGVVYGVNMSSTRLDFTIIDATGGIKIFNTHKFGYTVKEGDEVEVVGKVGFYNGLTEMVSLDTVIRLDSNKNLKKPKVVTSLDESTESDYIRLEGVWIVNPVATWPSNGNLEVTNGTDTIMMRIDRDTDIPGTAAPAGKFDVNGIGGQFDFSIPRDEGYQFLPSRLTDIDSTPYMPRPDFPIGTVNTLDMDGRPDSIGVKCRVTGIVYGINFRPGGLTFTLIDNSGGIGVFESSKDLGYTVTEGDSVMVQGEVGFYNGLTQMTRLDSVVLLSQGHMLKDPMVVTSLDETSESNLVKLEKVWLTGTETKWPNNGNIDLTNGTDTFTIRIDRDVNIADSAIMYDTMNIVGLGGQFDFSAPYTSGYQLFPRYDADITEWKEPVSVKNINGLSSRLYPNPNNGVFTVESSAELKSLRLMNAQGSLVSLNDVSTSSHRAHINATDLPGGMYILAVETSAGTVFHQMVVQ